MIRILLLFAFFTHIFLAGNSLYADFTANDTGSCGKFVQDYDFFHQNMVGKPIYETQKYADFYYIKGYVVGFINGSSSRVERKITMNDTAGWFLYIYNYCKENPLEGLLNAIIKLDIELDNK